MDLYFFIDKWINNSTIQIGFECISAEYNDVGAIVYSTYGNFQFDVESNAISNVIINEKIKMGSISNQELEEMQ